MKTIKFDPSGGKLIANVKMTGVVFISYTFLYWSANKDDRKLLINKPGNNKQPHDNNFILVDPENPDEPISVNHNRIIELNTTVAATQENDTPYEIVLEVFQDNDNNGMTDNNLIGSVKTDSDVIKKSTSPKHPVLIAKMESI